MAEQIITLNLRRGFIKTPTWRKSKRAANEVRDQVMHYAKVNEVTISKWVNELIWAHGAKNPPAKIKLRLDVDKEKKTAKAELFELPAKAKKEIAKLKSQEDKKKKTDAAKAAKEEKEVEFKKKKEEEQKKLEEAKQQKEKAVMTKEQEMAINKK